MWPRLRTSYLRWHWGSKVTLVPIRLETVASWPFVALMNLRSLMTVSLNASYILCEAVACFGKRRTPYNTIRPIVWMRTMISKHVFVNMTSFHRAVNWTWKWILLGALSGEEMTSGGTSIDFYLQGHLLNLHLRNKSPFWIAVGVARGLVQYRQKCNTYIMSILQGHQFPHRNYCCVLH